MEDKEGTQVELNQINSLKDEMTRLTSLLK